MRVSRTLSHIGEVVLVGSLTGVFALMPIRYASALGGFLARNVGPYLQVNKIAKRNLELVMPNLTAAEQKQILMGMWDNLGRTVAEFPHMRFMRGKKYKKLVELVGEEYLIEAQEREKQGQSTIFFSGHFANWEILPKTMVEYGCPTKVMYRKANNPYVNRIIQYIRNGYQTQAISKTESGVRQLTTAVKQGSILALLIDQRASEGMDVPLLGVSAKTGSAIARLGLKYDCLLVPAQMERISKAPKFRVTLHPPVKIYARTDNQEDVLHLMTEINDYISRFIIARPGEWFWVHQRWGKRNQDAPKS